jgi:hypothetical protein
MATGYRSVSSYANSQAAAGRALPVPAGAVVDDIIVVYANCWLSAAAAFTWTISGGTGTWNQVVNTNYTPDDGVLYSSVWWKRATGTESGSYTVGGWAGSQWTEAVAVAISGIPNTVASPVAAQIQPQAAAGTAYPTLSSGAISANDPALVWFGDSYDYDSDTPPTGFTERFDGGQTISAATRIPAAAGTYSTAGASHANSTFGTATLVTIVNAAGLTPVTKTAPLAWNVRSGVTKTAALEWNVAGAITGVTKTADLGWNVRAGVTKTAPLAWNVLGDELPFVTSISANNRYFLDQFGEPILLKGDSPWSAFVDISTTDWNTYCANRAGLGFNSMLCSLIGSVTNGGPNNNGQTFDGVLPFVSGNVLNWNETYWSRIDTFLDIAEQYGITIFLYVIDGWTISTVFSGVSAANCTTFGEMVAERFADRPNIVWMFGGDYAGDTTNDAKMGGALAGIQSTGDTRLASCQLIYQRTWTTQRTYWQTRADFDFVYSYPVQYDATYAAYTTGLTIPSVWMEGHYGGENDGFSATNVKRQAGWAMTQGSPGHFYGSDDWEFHSGWASRLNTLFAPEVATMADIVEEVPRWWDLVPNRTLISSGAGMPLDASGVGQTNDPSVDPSQSTYATGAVTPDGAVALIYLPTQRAIGVNTALLGSGATGTWLKADGTTSTASGALTGTVTPPSSGDWFLLVEANTSVTKTVDLGWNVRSEVAKTADLGWNVRSAVIKDAPLAWNVREGVAKTADMQWNVRTPVTKTADLAWNVRTAVTKTAALAWNVEADSGLTGVTKTVDLAWNIAAGVTVARALAWNIRTAVTKDADLRWNARAGVTKMAALEWDVHAGSFVPVGLVDFDGTGVEVVYDGVTLVPHVWIEE